MSELGAITAAVVELLDGLESGGERLFATVTIQQSERKMAIAALGRMRKPVAAVLYDGRGPRNGAEQVPGAATLAVLVATENLGGGGRAMVGDGVRSAAFACLETATAALDGAVVAGEYRLGLYDERRVAGDERAVVFEQRYRAERFSMPMAPMFGGVALAGSDGVVTVSVGPLVGESVEFGFPGIGGVYRHHTGTRRRTIHWEGQLVADGDVTLNMLEAGFDDLVTRAMPATLVDCWGRFYPECVLEAFERRGGRLRHAVTGRVSQVFKATFAQLRV